MKNFLRITIIVSFITLLSRTTGLIREAIIAWKFGFTPETDALSIAMSIPYAFYSIIGLSITTATIPLLARYNTNENDRNSIISTLFITIAIIATATALLLFITSQRIAKFIGKGLQQATLEQAANLIDWSLPSIIFLSLTGACAGILNYSRKFISAAIAPGLLNILTIATIIVFADEISVRSAIIGIQIGSLCGLVLLLTEMYRAKLGMPTVKHLNLKFPKEVMSDIWPITILATITYCYLLVDYRFASQLSPGIVTAFNYANKFMQLPQGLFVTAVATVIYPKLSDLAKSKEHKESGQLIRNAVELILFMAIPSVAFLVITSNLLTDLIFNHNGASEGGSTALAAIILYLSLGLPGFCINLPLTRVFYAYGDKKTPLIVGIFCIGIKIGISYMTVERYGHNGLALSTSIAISINSLILAIIIQTKNINFINTQLLIYLTKILTATGIMTLILTHLPIPGEYDTINEFSSKIFILAIYTTIGAGVYLALCKVFKINPLKTNA